MKGLTLLAMLLAAGCLTGCVGAWTVSDGRVDGTWRPAIIFRTDTAVLFNDGNEPLLHVEFGVEGSGETLEGNEDEGS